MNVTFYGATREVTGSMHLLKDESDYILLDCGMFQGRRKECEQKNKSLPFDPEILTNMALSHAHIDHSGRIPLLVKNNFKGRVICTRATADACAFLLKDSAHIQESDAQYLNYKMLRSFLSKMKSAGKDAPVDRREQKEIKEILKKGGNRLDTETISELIKTYHLREIEPLYSIRDAENALRYFDGYPNRHSIEIGRDMTLKFYEAGHILGSAFSVIKSLKNGVKRTVFYTGDLGRFHKPLLKDPVLAFEEEDRDVDLLIIESTYGNRRHEPIDEMVDKLKSVLVETFNRGGSVLIPSFAFGRTQEIVYALHKLYNNKEAPRAPIYVDSPLATNLTRVFGEHLELFDRETHRDFLEAGENPFTFDRIEFIGSVEESMALMREKRPHVVIASSGMCEGGRILHHLRYKAHNENNTILIVGYMAANTLGRRILEQGREYEKSGRSGPPPLIKFFNKEYPLRAHVEKLDGFSAHADRDELLSFIEKSDLNIKKIAVVHGEEDQALSFGRLLENKGYSVIIPKAGQSMAI